MNYSVPDDISEVEQLPGVIRLTLLPTMNQIEFDYMLPIIGKGFGTAYVISSARKISAR